MMSTEKWTDSKLTLKWDRTGADLRVYTPEGELVYTSVVGFVHPDLSARQAKWISDHYNAKRKNYVFV